MIEQFYLIHRLDPNIYNHSCVRVDQGVMAIKGNSSFSKLQD